MKIKFFLLLFSGLLLNTTSALAGVVINSTRAIYPEGKREITVRLESQNDYPTLIQSWIDNGKKDEEIKKIKVPFILLPPVTRIEPYQGQSLRISYTGEGTLSADKESVFWLNVLEIPPKSSAEAGGLLQMALRTRIKLFFRPKAIQGLSPAESAEKITWRLTEKNKQTSLEADNNTPFHVSIVSIEADTGGKPVIIEGKMIAPFSKGIYTFPGKAFKINKFKYYYINDYGANVPVEKEFK